MVLTTKATCFGLTRTGNDSTAYELPNLDYNSNLENVDSKWELLLRRDEAHHSEEPKGEAGGRTLEDLKGGGNGQTDVLFSGEKGNGPEEVSWKVESQPTGKFDLIKFHVVETAQTQLNTIASEHLFISEDNKSFIWNRGQGKLDARKELRDRSGKESAGWRSLDSSGEFDHRDLRMGSPACSAPRNGGNVESGGKGKRKSNREAGKSTEKGCTKSPAEKTQTNPSNIRGSKTRISSASTEWLTRISSNGDRIFS